MHEQEPTTQTMKASDVRAQWSQVLTTVFRQKTRVIVEKSGIPVAAVISAADLQRLTALDQQRAERFEVLDTLRAAFQDVPDADIEREVARAISAVRAEKQKRSRQAAKTP